VIGLAILAAIAWRLGTGPFLDGVRAVNAGSLTMAVLVTAVTTVCSAWRWQVVARGLGVDLRLGSAVAAYYRSQLLNTALPGGVLGDVHRAVDHGRAAGHVGRGVRAVAWERVAGQLVQVAVTLAVLTTLPSPIRPALPAVFAGGLAAVVTLIALARYAPRRGTSVWARARRAMAADVRNGLVGRRAWPAITASSLLVVAGHVVVFLVAAHAVGVHAGLRELLPLALLVLVAAAVPTNIGGWGPREGVAAWAFAAAGFGADRGVATATAFGVLVLAASLPGAIVLVVGARHRTSTAEPPCAEPPAERSPVGALDG
jgi:uncharacterized membrane protein YbhN (UPF0104 family)